MKKLLLATLLIDVFLLPGIGLAKYSGGTGEPNNPYLIATPNDMNEIGTHPEDWGSYFILVNDVNLANYTETEFNLIGVWVEKHDSNNKPFTGVFDGNDHTISNFTYKSNDANCIGLFVYVDQDAVIKDLTLIDPNIHTGAWWCAGVIIGYLQGGTIQGCGVEGGSIFGAECVGGLLGRNQGMVLDCYVTGIVSRGNYSIGGFVGYNWFGTISNCFAIATVTGDIHHAGGLAGSNRGTISNSWATGTVTGNKIVGGLAGDNSVLGGNISNCYATCTVDGIEEVGGLLGENDGGTSTSNCYAAGTVQGDVLVGGLVGHGYGDVYTKCFWDNEINPNVNAIGNGTNQNVVGKSTADMKKESTFTDAGWDFTTPVWLMCDEGEYPKLWWQGCNTPPLAVAGPNQTVYAYPDGFADVTLDGSASYDDDNDVLDYYWSWTIDSNIYEANGVSPAIQLPIGEHQIELIVDDGIEESEPDYCTITVIEPLRAKLHCIPRVLNTQNRRKTIVALLAMPDGILRSDINQSELLVFTPGNVIAQRQYVFQWHKYGRPCTWVMAVFNKSDCMPHLSTGQNQVEVTGKLNDGRFFFGTDTIKIINPKNKPRPNANRYRRRR